ncbi:hypothetical protein [Streptomyces montanisoli]|nr:hypothetical protein [Streptomyces montanisoli]
MDTISEQYEKLHDERCERNGTTGRATGGNSGNDYGGGASWES